MNLTHYFILVLAVIVPIIAYTKKSLTLVASIEAIIMVFISQTAGNGYAVFLLFEFMLISIIERICRKKTAHVDENLVQKSGTRDFIQVFANGGVATLSVILWAITKKTILLYCFVAALIESFGDSVASDVGVAYGRRTYDICRFKEMTMGLSGGISFEGTAACFTSCIAMSSMAYILRLTDSFRETAFIAIASFGGCLLDSVLGSLIQRKEQCVVCGIITEKRFHCGARTAYHGGVKWIDNDIINLLCNIFSAIVSLILLIFWG